jgi:hypothetical protein
MVAPFADIMDSIKPTLQRHGFSLRFDSERDGAILTTICYAMHTGGHQESARFHSNAANAQGGDMGAMTTGKRGAVLAMFGLTVRRNDDARIVGEYLLPEQLADLKARVAAVGNVNEAKFLKLAGVEPGQWTEIRAGKLQILYDWLRRHGAGPATPPTAGTKPDVDLAGLQSDKGLAWLKSQKTASEAIAKLAEKKTVTLEAEAFIKEQFEAWEASNG